jgi:transketolase
MKITDTARLQKIAFALRQDILAMIYQAQSGHPAGSLGMVDLLLTLYASGILRHDPQRANWEKRDYFLLSNGHICPALYAVLAQQKYFSREELESFRRINSRLEGHPHFLMNGKTIDKNTVQGIEITSGSLGHGSSQAAGLAYGLQIDNKKNHVFCLLSDGEQQEGQTWEAYMFASHHRLKNLTFIIDYNHIQISGKTQEVMSLGNLKLKLIAFGLHVLEMDAHDFTDIQKKLQKAKDNSQQTVAIIAHSTPGKGVSFMENDYRWHGQAPNKKEFESAMQELRIKKQSGND